MLRSGCRARSRAWSRRSMHDIAAAALTGFLVDRLHVGMLAVDEDMKVVLWNRFMEIHSGKSAADVMGRNLFEAFPDLPMMWVKRKVETVLRLEHYAFSSWR